MTAEYTYRCEGCGKEVTRNSPYKRIPVHWTCPSDVEKPKFYRVWHKTAVIFKAQGYSKNNLTR